MEKETKPRIKRRKLSKLRNKHGSQKMEKQLKFLRATPPPPSPPISLLPYTQTLGLVSH